LIHRLEHRTEPRIPSAIHSKRVSGDRASALSSGGAPGGASSTLAAGARAAATLTTTPPAVTGRRLERPRAQRPGLVVLALPGQPRGLEQQRHPLLRLAEQQRRAPSRKYLAAQLLALMAGP